MTYLNAVRPAANRHWGAGPDSDHTRMAAELAAMSQDDTRTKHEIVSAATTTPQYRAPYDHRMSDRFHPTLSTR
ncbi:hypothetical protein [Janibacter sp. Soil728]|uniref:hypothetical protein n=1 Tax=Janibacter sp. Soil728 TaxID=1736393 RepID=UPI00138EE266|nr:hypothetical protein [Janibacter sp. Soil728]